MLVYSLEQGEQGVNRVNRHNQGSAFRSKECATLERMDSTAPSTETLAGLDALMGQMQGQVRGALEQVRRQWPQIQVQLEQEHVEVLKGLSQAQQSLKGQIRKALARCHTPYLAQGLISSWAWCLCHVSSR